MPNPAAARAFYAIDATAVELTWITGPALAVTLGAAASTGFALAVAAAVATIGTLAFAAHPASRGWRPLPTASHVPARPGRSPGLRTLILVMGSLGIVFSAVQVGAPGTSELGAAGAAGPLLAVWGAGSLLGGLVATRVGGGARSAAGVCATARRADRRARGGSPVVATSTLGDGRRVLLLAGATIAPTEASVYSIVDDVAPGRHADRVVLLAGHCGGGRGQRSAQRRAARSWRGRRPVSCVRPRRRRGRGRRPERRAAWQDAARRAAGDPGVRPRRGVNGGCSGPLHRYNRATSLSGLRRSSVAPKLALRPTLMVRGRIPHGSAMTTPSRT